VAAPTRAAGGRNRVVVVGAGPVGLLLAAELRLGGAEVVVLESREAPTTESRASTLHARTMEILDSRGLLDRFGTPPNEPRGHFGGIPLDLTLPGPYPGQWKVPQVRTEAVLQTWARSLGADIRRGHTVTRVDPGEDGVQVSAQGPGGEICLRAGYLVACDGQDSTVRGLVAAEFPGLAAERRLLRADVAGISIPDRRFQRLERGMAVAARRGDGVTRVMVHEFDGAAPVPGREPDFGAVVDVWKRVTGEDISGGTPLWTNAFDDASAQLSHYRHGRVLFAGDAAHRQLPVGGQALNLGLQDAFNLGWKLALAARSEDGGTWTEQLLDSYHAERHPVGMRVLTNIRAQALLLLGGPDVEAVRSVFAELIGIEEARARLAGTVSGLDIRYDPGPDCGSDPAADELVGGRVPPEALDSAARAALRAGRGFLLDRPDAATPGRLLVRPDGYVAWADPALRTAVTSWE